MLHPWALCAYPRSSVPEASQHDARLTGAPQRALELGICRMPHAACRMRALRSCTAAHAACRTWPGRSPASPAPESCCPLPRPWPSASPPASHFPAPSAPRQSPLIGLLEPGRAQAYIWNVWIRGRASRNGHLSRVGMDI